MEHIHAVLLLLAHTVWLGVGFVALIYLFAVLLDRPSRAERR